MKARQIRRQDISDEKIVKRLGKKTKTINGQKVFNNPQVLNTVSMRNFLVDQKLILPEPTRDIKEISLMSLGALGITIKEDIDREYSLLNTETNKELLENKNIIDPNLKKVENSLSDPKNKFVSQEDTFYELDEGPSTFKKNQQNVLKKQNKKDLSRISSDMFKMNNGRSGFKKLKQFTK